MRKVALFVLVLVALAFLGALFQGVATALDSRRFPPPGQLVDLGGHKLHLRCYGEGSPTLLFEAGAGGSSLDWAAVEPLIAGLTRTCLYDRAGLGWSEPAPNRSAPTSGRVAEQLHLLLERAGEKGPFVLVAHSLGGLHAQVFAGAYPELVAGLVLVDPTRSDPIGPARGIMTAAEVAAVEGVIARGNALIATMGKVQAWLYRLGIARLMALAGTGTTARLAAQVPEPMRGAYRAVNLRTQVPVTALREIQGTATSAEEAARVGSLGETPVALLRPVQEPGGGAPEGFSPELAAKMSAYADQEEVLDRSANGRLIAVPGSGHYIQLDQPSAVAEAIRGVLGVARKGGL